MNDNSWLWQVFLGAFLWAWGIGKLVEGSQRDAHRNEDDHRGGILGDGVVEPRALRGAPDSRIDGQIIDFETHRMRRDFTAWARRNGHLVRPEMMKKVRKVYLGDEG